MSSTAARDPPPAPTPDPAPRPACCGATPERVWSESQARLETGDDRLRAVCHDNAARLFGL
nr:hypothetical protein [Streptosporangium nondiastaticum]